MVNNTLDVEKKINTNDPLNAHRSNTNDYSNFGQRYKDLAAKDTYQLGDVIIELGEESSDLDKVRTVLALRMAQYNSIELTKDDLYHIKKTFNDIQSGSATNLVMICKKSECLYKTRCRLYQIDKCPEDMECMHENYVYGQNMNAYLEALEVDISNHPEMVLINQLVEYELLEYRCNAILSNYHKDMKMESVVGVDNKGNIVTKEEVSHAFNIKMQLQKSKIYILESFTATRREKWKKQSALKEAKESQVRQLSSLKAKLKDLKNKEIDRGEVTNLLDNPLKMIE